MPVVGKPVIWLTLASITDLNVTFDVASLLWVAFELVATRILASTFTEPALSATLTALA